MRIQPSEIGKVILALALAEVCSKIPPTEIKGIAAAIGLGGVMIVLILLQPDLGKLPCLLSYAFCRAGRCRSSREFLSGIVISILAMLPVAWMFLKTLSKNEAYGIS